MPKEVVVALIAVAGVSLTQMVTYAISRQNANDLRVNIDREINIIRKLHPGSEEAVKLVNHIKASVSKLIYRDERREQLAELVRSLAPIVVLGVIVAALDWWRRDGVPELLSLAVAIVFYGLFVMWAWLTLVYVWQVIRLLIVSAQILLLKIRATYLVLHTRYIKVRTWFARRQAEKSKRTLVTVIGIVDDILNEFADDPDPEMQERLANVRRVRDQAVNDPELDLGLAPDTQERQTRPRAGL